MFSTPSARTPSALSSRWKILPRQSGSLAPVPPSGLLGSSSAGGRLPTVDIKEVVALMQTPLPQVKQSRRTRDDPGVLEGGGEVPLQLQKKRETVHKMARVAEAQRVKTVANLGPAQVKSPQTIARLAAQRSIPRKRSRVRATNRQHPAGAGGSKSSKPRFQPVQNTSPRTTRRALQNHQPELRHPSSRGGAAAELRLQVRAPHRGGGGGSSSRNKKLLQHPRPAHEEGTGPR
mmetsp:Transcript_11760/g.33957  ORF Transcript_11760/g.33957 Transcript_11760/m.33957 type:complete len:233 (+) Transcript_11760:2413-3111(+)